MGSRRGTKFIPGDHPSQLKLAILALEALPPGHRSPTVVDFVNPIVTLRSGRHLGQMGHGQDLVGRREIAEKTGEGGRGGATESRVDLVEEQGHGAIRSG